MSNLIFVVFFVFFLEMSESGLRRHHSACSGLWLVYAAKTFHSAKSLSLQLSHSFPETGERNLTVV